MIEGVYFVDTVPSTRGVCCTEQVLFEAPLVVDDDAGNIKRKEIIISYTK